MTDYSQLSDFEINKRVAESLLIDHFANELEQLIETINGESGYYDPCNNPADAWPIIAGNKISLDFDGDGYVPQQNAWCKASTQCGHVYYGSEKEPLRNAMIAFLMLKDSEKGHG